MDDIFVKAYFDLDCEWEGLPPDYRIFVNGELFAERTWTYTNQFLREMLQIQGPAGLYKIRILPVGPQIAKWMISNNTIAYGPASWIDENTIEIRHESQ